jgi:hypothetical protein
MFYERGGFPPSLMTLELIKMVEGRMHPKGYAIRAYTKRCLKQDFNLLWYNSLYFVEIHAELATCFMFISRFVLSSNLKVEAICSSEASVDFQRTTRRSIPEDRTLHDHRCHNLKSYVYPKYLWGYVIIWIDNFTKEKLLLFKKNCMFWFSAHVENTTFFLMM